MLAVETRGTVVHAVAPIAVVDGLQRGREASLGQAPEFAAGRFAAARRRLRWAAPS